MMKCELFCMTRVNSKEIQILWEIQTDRQTYCTIQINQPTRYNFSRLLLDVYLQLNMYRASSRPSSGAQQLQQRPLVGAVGRGRAGLTTINSTAITTLRR
jgi:hypothetical protein